MKHKIAIITTKFLEEYIRAAFDEMQLDCTYEIYTYVHFRDLEEIFLQIPDDITGVLTSGSYPARVLRLFFPDTPHIIVPFNTDDQSICHLFLRLINEDRTLDFGRISADVISVVGVDLNTYLTEGLSYYLSVETEKMVNNLTLGELFQVEENIFNKHLSLWNCNEIDLCVTRFSSLVEPLKAHGVNVHFAYPSVIYLKEICLNLFREIEYRQMQEQCPAVISVSIDRISKDSKYRVFPIEHRILMVQSSLLELFRDNNSEYIIQCHDTTIDIMTQHKNVYSLTDNFRVCKIQDYLHTKFFCTFSIGYGLGFSWQHASNNAKLALKRAKQITDSASFLANEKNEILGPLYFTDAIKSSATIKKLPAGISAEKVKEVLCIINTFPDSEFTSQDLADAMSISKRSANRLLSAMLNENILEISRTQPTASKGRPERIYRAIPNIEF